VTLVHNLDTWIIPSVISNCSLPNHEEEEEEEEEELVSNCIPSEVERVSHSHPCQQHACY